MSYTRLLFKAIVICCIVHTYLSPCHTSFVLPESDQQCAANHSSVQSEEMCISTTPTNQVEAIQQMHELSKSILKASQDTLEIAQQNMKKLTSQKDKKFISSKIAMTLVSLIITQALKILIQQAIKSSFFHEEK